MDRRIGKTCRNRVQRLDLAGNTLRKSNKRETSRGGLPSKGLENRSTCKDWEEDGGRWAVKSLLSTLPMK